MIALFFDTETTGFRSAEFIPEIVQIGAVLQDTESRRVFGELDLIVKPKQHIPAQVSEIHGIDDEIARKYGIDKDVADNMFALLAAKADVLVAHNIAFDTDIIDGAWDISRAIVADKKQVCTMRSLITIMKLPKKSPSMFHDSLHDQYKAPKLSEAYRHFFDRDFDNAHDAMADVRACRDVYFAMGGHEA
jgi:DNA polymerase-3 subunit epsilon